MNIWVRVSDNMVLHSPSGIYYARKFKAGRGSFFKTTKLKTKGKAQSLTNDMISAWLADTGNKIQSYATINEVIDRLLVVLEEEFHNGDRAKETWLHDQHCLKVLRVHFGEMLASEIDESTWAGWVRTTGRGLNRTLGDIAKYLSKTLTFAFEQKAISRKPRIKNPDANKSSARVYTDAEIRSLFDAAEPLLKDLIIMGIECGVRPGENRELRWEMVAFKKSGSMLMLPEWFTKTRSYREFIIGPQTEKMLRRRFKARDIKSVFVFPSPKDPKQPIGRVHLSRIWRRAVKASGMDSGIKFHWLRHTFFTRALLDAGKDLPMVAAYGGNSPKILFDRYLSKEASRTKGVAGAVNVKLDDSEE